MPELYYFNIHISKKWFDNSNKIKGNKPEEIAFRFVGYWIAFNGLFAKYHSEENDTEAKQIFNFVEDNYNKYLKGLIDFKNSSDLAIFKERPVFSGSYIPPCTKEKFLNQKLDNNKKIRGYYQILNFQNLLKPNAEIDNLVALLLTIKQIRNNLFHGIKTPDPQRDYKLVDSSQKILKIILDAIIKD